jgi:uncharacterized protein YijF (DUF1287 family)
MRASRSIVKRLDGKLASGETSGRARVCLIIVPALLLSVALAVVAGLPDRGIFPDLDGHVALSAPAVANRDALWLRLDRRHGVLTLYEGRDPLKAYPVRVEAGATLPARTTVAGLADAGVPFGADEGSRVRVRPDDRDELAGLLGASTGVVVGVPDRAEDQDGDGIVDRLDILLGAKKLLGNGARYIERYVSIKYPGGDVPRSEGVCSDTVIRALRNAGIDLQREVHEDILRARAAYPMVEKVDASINHRRVRTLLPWFERHFDTLPPGARYLPGDIVFFDTFPSRPGPDHLGVVSDTRARSGNPMIINNWTDGAVDAEMDLLAFVPVTHHFRIREPRKPTTAAGALRARPASATR